jgi:hypothetical protein
MINMEAFGRNFKAIPLKHQPAHLKFIYNQLPLGDRRFQRSAVKDDNLKQCQQYKTTDEDIYHFMPCSQNTNRTKSITTMLKTILKDSHPSNPALASHIAMTTFLYPWLKLCNARSRNNTHRLAPTPSRLYIQAVASSCMNGPYQQRKTESVRGKK